MAKIEAVYLVPQGDGKWFAYSLDDGEMINHGITISLDLLKVLAPCVRVVFIENAYHVLACHGMFNVGKNSGIDYVPMDDGLPLVIMQDPPTIIAYKVGDDHISVMDPGNYGIVVDEQFPVQQLLAFRRQLRLKYWSGTASGTATACRLQVSSDPKTLQPFAMLPEKSLVESAFLGGNCGAGYYGQCPGNAFHYYDLQGAYLVSAEQLLPVRMLESGVGLPPIQLSADCMAEVTIKTDFPHYPYRPSLEVTNGRKLTYYPTGMFRTVLCGMELDEAVSRNHIVDVHRWELWERQLFLRPYSHLMQTMIATCHPFIRSAVKTIALAGLGWFGRKVKTWEVTNQSAPDREYCGDFFKLEENGVQRYRRVGNTVMRETVGGFHMDSSPQVWAWIASFVRWRLSLVLRHLAGHALYWDTDSVITDSRGAAIMEHMPDFDIRGGWKKKGTARSMHVWGYRRYSFGDVLSIGLPVSARDEPGGRYVWESPETWDEAMANRHYPDGTVVSRGGRIRGTYTHGRIEESGKIVPWHIEGSL